MSRQIEAMYSKFGVSEPVFVGRIYGDGHTVEFEVRDQYRPSSEGVTDPVELLVIDSYSESYNPHTKEFVYNENIEGVLSKIKSDLTKIFEQYSPLKNPRQSKLSKWLRWYNGGTLSEGFIALYRYAALHSDGGHKEFRFDGGKNNPHVKNIIAILEKMREKNEQ